MNEIVKIKKELEQLKSGLKCLLSLFPAATQWTPEHTISNNYKYLENTLVWHQGCIYKCKKDNSGADIQDEYFWEKIGFGFLLAQEQADWNATEGPSYIRNKPWNLGGQEQDPLFTQWLNSNPLSSYVTFNQASNSFYPLNSNPNGYLTPASAGLLYYPLNSNPLGYLTSASLSGYATEFWVENNFYPLASNPAGYLTQQEVLEYEDLATIQATHPIGTAGTIYIATNNLTTGVPVYYIWNGSAYVTTSQPVTGITGSGLINYLPKFTPDGVTLGNSGFVDLGPILGANYANKVFFLPGSNIFLKLDRGQSKLDFFLGNPDISQTSSLISNNTYGLEIISSAASAFLALKAGGFEGLKILPTGQLKFTQTPSAGTISDSVIVRDSLGNIKIVPYPTTPSLSELYNVNITSPQNTDVLMYNNTVWENKNPFDYFDAKPIIYQKHINIPAFGSPSINNVEGVTMPITGPVARSWADTDIVSRTQRLGLNVSVTTNTAQIRQTIVYFSRNGGFDLLTGFNMAENASDTAIRFFIGISANIIFTNVEPNTLLNCVGICRLSTSNNLHIVYNDNTGIGTTIDLGSNFPANTISTDKYLLKIKAVSTGIYIKLERVGTAFSYETTLTSDIPSTSTGLNFGAYIVDTSGPNTTTGFDWYGSYITV